jgi:CHASE3 domain sensor protein
LQQSSPTIRLLLGIAGVTSLAWVSLALIAFTSFKALTDAGIAISHSADRLEAALAIQAAILRSQREVREYIISPSQEQLQDYQRESEKIKEQLGKLNKVAREEPLLAAEVGALGDLVQEKQAQSSLFIRRVQQVGPEQATAMVVAGPLLGQASQTDTELQNLISGIQGRELLLQGEKEGVLQRNLVVASATMTAGAGLGVLTLGGSIWIAVAEIRRRSEAERLTSLANLELASALSTASERSCAIDGRPSLSDRAQSYLEDIERIRNPGGERGTE